MLTVAALITKVLSAFYRIPFQNLVGDVGFYIYQQVYPFYGFALVLSTYGFPVIISKMYIEKKTLEGDVEAATFMRVATRFLACIGTGLFLLMFFGAPYLAVAMEDPHLTGLLQTISFIFLLFPFQSVLRGYFQGNNDMGPTAFSQVGEQLIRVLTILMVAYMWRHEDLYQVSAGAMSGAIAGGVASVSILLAFFVKTRKKRRTKAQGLSWQQWSKITSTLFIQGIAISISSALLLFIQLADSLNLFSLLSLQVDQPSVAKEWKGVYDRGIPLIQLGTVVATSMSLALVPLISSERMKRQGDQLQDKIRMALLVSIVIGAGASLGLMSIIKPANIMLFEDALGSSILAMQSSIILLSSFIITLLSILQGLGYISYSAILVVLAALIKYIGNLWLVPAYGAEGAVLATILALVLIALLLFIKLARVVPGQLLKGVELLKIGISGTTMVLILKAIAIIQGGTIPHPSRIEASVEALCGVSFGGFIYLICILRLHTFKEQELLLLPFGSKLVKLLPNRKRS